MPLKCCFVINFVKVCQKKKINVLKIVLESMQETDSMKAQKTTALHEKN